MKRVGLTGGIGSGKSLAESFFKELGIPVFDADIIGRELLQPSSFLYHDIINLFGDVILDNDETISRKAIKESIFKDVVKRRQLERLLHPAIIERLLALSQKGEAPYCILSIPLLFEANFSHIVDYSISIACEPSLRLERIIARDKISESLARKIIESQMSESIRNRLAHEAINNSDTPDKLNDQIKALHQRLIKCW